MGWILLISISIGVIAGIWISVNDSQQTQKRGDFLKKKFNALTDFKPSTSITGVKNSYIFSVDNENKKILYLTPTRKIIIPFSKIMSVEILEDNQKTFSKSLGGTIGGTIIGSALAGTTGGIVGGLSSKQKENKKVSSVKVIIQMRDMSNPALTIYCFNSRTMTATGASSSKVTGLDGYEYREGMSQARRIYNLISVIIDNEEHNAPTTNQTVSTSSKIMELEKLASLKDSGVLTEEEFQKMKSSIIAEPVVETSVGSSDSKVEVTISDTQMEELLKKGEFVSAVDLYMKEHNCEMNEALERVTEYSEKIKQSNS
jgi:hypothetical protein